MTSTLVLLPGDLRGWEWQGRGACLDADPDLFFHPYGEREPSRSRRDEAARAVCVQCPVQLRCREHAHAVAEPYGVWGGETETERADVLAGLSGLSVREGLAG